MTEKINLKRLEKELVAAVEADKKYWRENDAKFRAVHQKVATYEEFRDIVKAAHLAPLDRKDLLESAPKQPWNPVVAATTPGVGDLRSKAELRQAQPSDGQIPHNAQDFMRTWRALKAQSAESQYRFLLTVGGEQLQKIFKVEIGILGEILTLLNECFCDEDGCQVTSILKFLSETPRHKLTLEFFTGAERAAAQDLFAKLLKGSAVSPQPPALIELARVYQVNIDRAIYMT